MAEKNCFDAIERLDGAMRSCLESGQQYYVLGGIATSAIRHADTSFDHVYKEVSPAIEAAEPVNRDNGTLRDVDVLVDSVLCDEQAQTIVESLKKDTPLVVSVFGLDERHEVAGRKDRVMRSLADWTSRRTIDEEGVIRYELFPLEQKVQPESFKPWTLILPNGSSASVLSPPAHMLAYRMRSISGVRFKDTEKLNQMTDRVMAIPEFHKEIKEGVYREWFDFAQGIYRIQDGKMKLDDPMLSAGTTKSDLALFSLKGRALHRLESNKSLIKLAQSPIGERLLSPFTRTK